MIDAIRAEFPTLHQQVHGHPLTWLDSAATTQKPVSVIEAMDRYYREDNANVHRGVHELSARSTASFEAAREGIRRFLGAREARECIFVRGTTEGINLVANTWGTRNVREGDEILISGMEHHSNIVPWQMLAERTGAKVRAIPIDEHGALRMDEFERLLTERTKIVAVMQVSNALGTVNPIRRITEMAHAKGAIVVVDGAQATAHVPVDVQALDADFYAMSAHKMYGPTGIGVLYGKAALLEAMPPWQGGGDMIRSVTLEKTTYAPIPAKFEAGTPNVAGVIGLGAAVAFMERVASFAETHEAALLRYGHDRLPEVPGLRFVGTAPGKVAILSFVIDRVHPHDLGTILDRHGVAIRTGHHCAQPVMQFYKIPATARASLGVYNTTEDIDRLVDALQQAVKVLR